LNEEARRFLFEERRLDARVVRWCRLTSWKDRQGVPWLQIPYYQKSESAVYCECKWHFYVQTRHFFVLKTALSEGQNGTFRILNKQLKKNGKKIGNKCLKIW